MHVKGLHSSKHWQFTLYNDNEFARHKTLTAQNQIYLKSSKTLHYWANPFIMIRIVVEMNSRWKNYQTD